MNLTCPRCGDICAPSAIFCIGCGSALLTAEATKAALAKIRADGEAKRHAVRSENGRRTGKASKGRTMRRCPYCGARCVGEACAQHRDLVALEDRR